MEKETLVYWLRCWIPNPMVLGSKPPCGSKVESAIHFSEVDQMGTRNFLELNSNRIKSKLSPCSGSVDFRQFNSVHKKGP